MKFIAIYVRVISKQQDQRSQEPDLKRWVAAQERDVVWYRDKFTGQAALEIDFVGHRALETQAGFP